MAGEDEEKMKRRWKGQGYLSITSADGRFIRGDQINYFL